MFNLPGLELGRDLSLRIGDEAEVMLTPRAGLELAEALLRGSAEKAVREGARTALNLKQSKRRVAA